MLTLQATLLGQVFRILLCELHLPTMKFISHLIVIACAVCVFAAPVKRDLATVEGDFTTIITDVGDVSTCDIIACYHVG